MIPTYVDDKFPHVTGKDAFERKNRRAHQYAGLWATSALCPTIPAMKYYKGGGGGLIAGIVIGAVLGVLTAGVGLAIFGVAGMSAGMGFGAATALGFSGMSAVLVGGAIMGAASALLSGVAGMIMGKPSSGEEAQAQSNQARDNKFNSATSVGPRKKIYGTAYSGGHVEYRGSTGSTKEYLHEVVSHASHQCKELREAYFNNLAESNSRFSGFYRINRHVGTQTQTADSDLVSENSEWTTAHRGRGVAYHYSRIKYDTNAWVTGKPNISMVVDGGILYDPRNSGISISTSVSGSPGTFNTIGAHGLSAGDIVFIRSHTGATYASSNGRTVSITKKYTVNSVPTSSSFTLLNEGGNPLTLLSSGSGGTVTKCGWTTNWALAVLDFLTSIDGINCREDEVDWSYFEDAADVSDESVSLGTSETFTASASANSITLADGTGWQTGTQVYLSSDGMLPSPLVSGSAYYWIRNDATTGQLASSYENAAVGTFIDITDAGTGTHTATLSIGVTLSASNDTVTLPNVSSYIETGDYVRVDDAPQSVRREAYTVITPDPPNEDIVTEYPEATMTRVSGAPSTDQYSYSNGVYTFNATDQANGRQVKIGSGSFQAIPVGLTITEANPHAGQSYYWFNTGYLTGKLASSRANAMAGTAINLEIDGASKITRVSQARYTINGIIDLSKKPIETLVEMLGAGSGVVVYTQGKYRLFAATAAAPVKTITEDDFAGSIRILPHTARANLINAIRGTYKEPAKYWEMTDFPPITSATYEEEDGGSRLYKDMTFPHTIDPQRAQRLASIILNRGRRGLVINMTTKVNMLGISAWDCVQFDSDILGFSGKKFRVVSWQLNENGQGIDLTLNEEDDAIYTWSPGQGSVVPQVDLSTLPDPWNVNSPYNIAVTEELYVTRDGAGVKAKATMTWGNDDEGSYRYTVARYRLQGSGDNGWIYLNPSTTLGTEILDIAPGIYEFQAQNYNTLGAYSPWDQSETVTKEIFGLGAAPSPMQNLTISAISSMALMRWTQSNDIDVRIGGKVVFRHSSLTTAATWADSTSIGQAMPGTDTVAVLPLLPGTYLSRFVDSSGVMSDVASVTTDGATVLAYSTVASVTESPTFPGTKTNLIVSGGSLMLGGSANIDDIPDFDAMPSVDFAGGIATSGTYEFAAGIDLGSVQRVRLVKTLESIIENTIDLIDDRDTPIDTWESFDGDNTGNADAVVYVSYTLTDPLGSPVWSDWQRLDVAEFNARAFKFKCELSTEDAAYNIKVSTLTVTAEQL